MTTMTTEELLWNAAFEDVDEQDTSYEYREERAKENYYNNKDLFEQFGDYFNPKNLQV